MSKEESNSVPALTSDCEQQQDTISNQSDKDGSSANQSSLAGDVKQLEEGNLGKKQVVADGSPIETEEEDSNEHRNNNDNNEAGKAPRARQDGTEQEDENKKKSIKIKGGESPADTLDLASTTGGGELQQQQQPADGNNNGGGVEGDGNNDDDFVEIPGCSAFWGKGGAPLFPNEAGVSICLVLSFPPPITLY